MAGSHFNENHRTVKLFHSEAREESGCIQNHESFESAVHEITPSQGLEKIKMAAIFMKITEP